MARHARLATVVVAVAVTAAVAGCSDGASTSGERPGDIGAGVAPTIPPSRLTPFCQAMIELSDRLETEQVEDEVDLILETYLGILDEVPAEIEEDFLVVIARLQRGDVPELAATSTTRPDGGGRRTTTTTEHESSVPETTDSGAAEGESTLPDAEYEGWTPDDDPSIRVNGYVDFVCRYNLNNPGPAATQPPPPELEDTEPEDTQLDGTAPEATVGATS